MENLSIHDMTSCHSM